MNNARIQNFTMIVALREVFHRFSYVLLAGVISFGFFVFAVWLPNLKLVAHTIAQGNIAFSVKLTLLLNLLESIGTNFTVFSAITMIIIAILFGVNIATIIYFIRKRSAVLSGGSLFVSIGGIGSGVVGIGCAACGSFFKRHPSCRWHCGRDRAFAAQRKRIWYFEHWIALRINFYDVS